MENFVSVIELGILRLCAFIFDLITHIPYQLMAAKRDRLRRANEIRAKQVGPTPAGPYRSTVSLDRLSTTLFTECETLDDLFRRAVKHNGPRNCLGTRQLLKMEDEPQPNGKVFKKMILGDYEWLTFNQVDKRLDNFGKGLLATGQKAKDNLIIFADTRTDWMVTALTGMRFNIPIVTLYATLGDEAVIYGINETEVSHVVLSPDALSKFLKILDKVPKVKCLIYIDAGGKRADTAAFKEKGIQVLSMTEVEELGTRPENAKVQPSKPTANDLAVMMYTSGSTGLPKGVMISHSNLMCGMSGQCEKVPDLGFNDCYIGYLPLAHVLELSAELSCLANGCSIGYSSPQTITDNSTAIKRGCKGDISVLRPTLMASVPMVMDRIYKTVWDKVNSSSGLRKTLFNFAYTRKSKLLLQGDDTPILNKIVFRKLQEILGGRIRLLLSGGAPLASSTQLFMKVCFSIPVAQGYGLTETCGAGTITDVYDLSLGRVGPPLTCNEIKLRDWEEGGYRSSDKPFPRGEILMGGGNVTLGYYKMQDKTDEDFFEEDGRRWFATGDIGEMHPDGVLKIIDRKKDLVKLQGGEYISLGKVESVMKNHGLVENMCVFGDSAQSFTVAVIAPNMTQLQALAKSRGVTVEKPEELCKNQGMNVAVLEQVTAHALKGGLAKFEIPTKITLVPDVWLPETGLVTDALKLKRRNLEQRYREEVEKMYSVGNSVKSVL